MLLPVQWLRSKIAGRRPGDGVMRAVLDGEPFINRRDGVMCWLDADGTLQDTPLLGGAPLASPMFTGTPRAPTPLTGDSSTRLSTTAFVAAALATLVDSAPATLDTLKELAAAIGNDPTFAADIMASLASMSAGLGQCELVMSGGNLVLTPKGGGLVTVNGVARQIPAGGVSLAPTGFVPGTNYFAYLAWVAGALVLEGSATGHAPNAAGQDVKSSDATRTLVGAFRPAGTVAAPAFVNSGTQRLVRSFYNSRQVSLETWLTSNTAVAANAPTDMPGMSLLEWFQWEREVPFAGAGSTWTRGGSALPTTLSIAVDGVGRLAGGMQNSGANYGAGGGPPAGPLTGLGEGYHTAKLQVANGNLSNTYSGDPTLRQTYLGVRLN